MFQQSESGSSASLLPAVVLERGCVPESSPAGNGLHQLPNAVAHLARFRVSARKRGGGEYVVNLNFLKANPESKTKLIGSLSALFRNFQASVFLAASDVHGQILDAESYDLAFGGIRRTPVRAFDRGQRNRILDGILGSISSTNLTTSMILDHVGVLIEYIGCCNNLSRVLCVVQKDFTRGSLQEFPVEQSPLLELVRRLDRDQVSASKMPALKALKKLGHSTLRYGIIISRVWKHC